LKIRRSRRDLDMILHDFQSEILSVVFILIENRLFHSRESSVSTKKVENLPSVPWDCAVVRRALVKTVYFERAGIFNSFCLIRLISQILIVLYPCYLTNCSANSANSRAMIFLFLFYSTYNTMSQSKESSPDSLLHATKTADFCSTGTVLLPCRY
jgi:hypothetical protein